MNGKRKKEDEIKKKEGNEYSQLWRRRKSIIDKRVSRARDRNIAGIHSGQDQTEPWEGGGGRGETRAVADQDEPPGPRDWPGEWLKKDQVTEKAGL